MPELSYIMTNVTGEEIGYDPVTVKNLLKFTLLRVTETNLLLCTKQLQWA